MMNKNMSMGEYLRFSTEIKHFLFEYLHIETTAGIVGACVVLFALAILIEGSKSLMMYVQLRLRQNPLTYGRTDMSIQNDRSPLFSALMIPSSIDQIKRQRIRYHVGGYLLHTFNLVLGYLLMLAIMSYDAYILLTVIAGSGIGYFIFGFVNAHNQAKFASLRSRVYERYDSQTALTENEPPVQDSR